MRSGHFILPRIGVALALGSGGCRFFAPYDFDTGAVVVVDGRAHDVETGEALAQVEVCVFDDDLRGDDLPDEENCATTDAAGAFSLTVPTADEARFSFTLEPDYQPVLFHGARDAADDSLFIDQWMLRREALSLLTALLGVTVEPEEEGGVLLETRVEGANGTGQQLVLDGGAPAPIYLLGTGGLPLPDASLEATAGAGAVWADLPEGEYTATATWPGGGACTRGEGAWPAESEDQERLTVAAGHISTTPAFTCLPTR